MKEGKLVFDPRPKLLLLFTMGVFVLGNAGGDLFAVFFTPGLAHVVPG